MRPWMKVILWVAMLMFGVFIGTLIITAIVVAKTFLL